MQNSIQNMGATYWGGDAGTVCNTVLLKPIMTCGEGCISDNRSVVDMLGSHLCILVVLYV